MPKAYNAAPGAAAERSVLSAKLGGHTTATEIVHRPTFEAGGAKHTVDVVRSVRGRSDAVAPLDGRLSKFWLYAPPR